MTWDTDLLFSHQTEFERVLRRLWTKPANDHTDEVLGLIMFIDGNNQDPLMKRNLRTLAVELGGEEFATFCEEHHGTSLCYLFDPDTYPFQFRQEYDKMQRDGTLSSSFIAAVKRFEGIKRRAGLSTAASAPAQTKPPGDGSDGCAIAFVILILLGIGGLIWLVVRMVSRLF